MHATNNKIVRNSYRYAPRLLTGANVAEWSRNVYSDNGQVIGR